MGRTLLLTGRPGIGKTTVIKMVAELLEEHAGGFYTEAISGHSPVIATIMSKPNPWVKAIKALPQVEVWEVTIETRGRIAERVVEWLKR